MERVSEIIIGVTLGEFFENGVEKFSQQINIDNEIVDIDRYVVTFPSGGKAEIYNETGNITIFNLQAIFASILAMSTSETLSLFNIPDQLTVGNLDEVIIGFGFGEVCLDGTIQEIQIDRFNETITEVNEMFFEELQYTKGVRAMIYAKNKKI